MQEPNFTRQELSALAEEKAGLMVEMQELLSGIVRFEPAGGRPPLVFTVPELNEGEHWPPRLEEAELRMLEENELFRLIRKGQEQLVVARLELVTAGRLSPLPGGELLVRKPEPGLFNRLVLQNFRLNRRIERVPLLGIWLSSTGWMLVTGLVLLIIWLYGNFTTTPSNNPPATPTPYSGVPAHGDTHGAPLKLLLAIRDEPDLTGNPAVTATPEPNRVGCKVNEAGGNNGPHGCFTAPSHLESRAIGLQADIFRATLLEEAENDGNLKLKVVPPVAGDKALLHYGAYPGETGNLLLFATSNGLEIAHRWQVGDEVGITDRRGSQYIYRIVPLSPAGQAEREVDISDPAENWVFSPDQPTAIATFLVSLPGPEGKPDQVSIPEENNRPSPEKSGQSSDWRLVYRAVLASYIPATTNGNASRVVVPESVWTPPTRGADATPVASTTTEPNGSATPEITSPVVTTTLVPVTGNSAGVSTQPTPYPGMPHSGEGSTENSSNNSFITIFLLVLFCSLALAGLLLYLRFKETKR